MNMKKSLAVAIILIFLSVSVIPSTGWVVEKSSELRWKARDIYGYETIWSDPISITLLPINDAELEIEIVTGLYTGAIIKNVGDEDAYNVNWCITVKGGMLNLVSVSGEGTINLLPHSDLIGTAVRLRQPTLGFGLVEITVTAIGENAELVMEKIDGLLLLFWIIQLS